MNSGNILDATSETLFADALTFFKSAGLDSTDFFVEEDQTTILPWQGDKIAKTLRHLLAEEEHEAVLIGGIIYTKSPLRLILNSLKTILVRSPNVLELAGTIDRKFKEEHKFDIFLPDGLLDIGFSARSFDLPGALDWIAKALGRVND